VINAFRENAAERTSGKRQMHSAMNGETQKKSLTRYRFRYSCGKNPMSSWLGSSTGFKNSDIRPLGRLNYWITKRNFCRRCQGSDTRSAKALIH
jgi:hypothetical protein